MNTKSTKGRPRATPAQPLDAALNPDAFLRMRTVEAITALSAATIYRKLAAKGFPEPVRDGKRCTRWRAGAVQAWLAART